MRAKIRDHTNSVGEQRQELRVDRRLERHHAARLRRTPRLPRSLVPRLPRPPVPRLPRLLVRHRPLRHPHCHRELLVVFSGSALAAFGTTEAAGSLGGLGTVGVVHIGLEFALALGLGTGLLLALGTVAGEGDGGFVELGLALVDGVAWVQVVGFRGLLLEGLGGEEQCGLDLNFASLGHFGHVGVSPSLGGLVVEGVAASVGRADGVEVGLAGVGGLVELVHHILIKLFIRPNSALPYNYPPPPNGKLIPVIIELKQTNTLL